MSTLTPPCRRKSESHVTLSVLGIITHSFIPLDPERGPIALCTPGSGVLELDMEWGEIHPLSFLSTLLPST